MDICIVLFSLSGKNLADELPDYMLAHWPTLGPQHILTCLKLLSSNIIEVVPDDATITAYKVLSSFNNTDNGVYACKRTNGQPACFLVPVPVSCSPSTPIPLNISEEAWKILSEAS